MNSSKIRIFIVDDHPLMREALKVSILTEEDMEIVGEAVDGEEAIEMIPALQPNVVLMDLMMPNMDGFEAIKNLSQRYPEIHILTFSSLEEEEAIFKAVQAGTKGYLLKNAQHDELNTAIRTVSTGKPYLPSNIMGKLMGELHQNLVKEKATAAKPIDSLTKREKEVLDLLAKGYSNERIGEVLFIAASTVRVYMHQLIKKLEFDNRRELVAFAARRESEK